MKVLFSWVAIAASHRHARVAFVSVAGWVGAFEFKQSLRLRVQQAQPTAQDTTTALQMANQVAIDELHEIDRRMLKESFRLVRQLQQRMELDYLR